MVAVIHRTPGLIPIEAFTIAGLSAKPNSNTPIGKFGTGLKYAIAVLVRMDISVTVYIGLTEYVFYKKKRQFRGQDYFAIRMKKRHGLLGKWSYHELPFTTEYGKYWELWQVYRELHANTLDEGGETFVGTTTPIEGETQFVIKDSRYVDVYHDRDRIFLPDGLKVRNDSEAIQVIDRPSNHIYFRGLRVMDLKKEAQFTYNFLENVDLTEDRTVKWPHMVEARIVGMMQESQDEAFIRRAVAKPKEDSYERGLNHYTGYSSGWSTAVPSPTYLKGAKDSPNASAKEVWNKKQPTVATSVHVQITIPKPYLSKEEVGEIVEAAKNIHPDSNVLVEGDPPHWDKNRR